MKTKMKFRFCLGLGFLVFLLVISPFLGIQVKAVGETVTWKCSTSSSPWVDMPSQTTTAWDNDTGTYVSVNSSIRYQVIDGWGGCFNERGWDALSVLSQTDRDTVMRALFDSNTGLKLNICRAPIGASDYAMTLYTLDDTAGDYAMNNFSISRDTQKLIPYIKAAMDIRPDLKLWGVPWSPPAWMKDNNSLLGGHIKTDANTMNALALYFIKYVQAYQDQGINLFMVMPQNEPCYETNYTSCLWNGAQLRDFIKNYLGPQFKNNNINCEIWLGTFPVSNYSGDIAPSLTDSTANSYIKGLGFQWGGDGAARDTHNNYPSMKLMQSETICGNHENNWTYAQDQFRLMQTYFTSWVNSYALWNMVLDETGLSTGNWAQCSPIVVNKSTKVVTYNPQYYMFKHFSYFVNPGAYRVDVSGNFGDKLAFINPNGEIVLEVQNSSANAATVAININGLKIKPTLPANSWNTFRLLSGPVPTPSPINPFNQIEAENYNGQSGIQTETCSDTGGGLNVGYIENGDYLVYNNINFGSGAGSFQARVASATSGGNIEIHLDSLSGALVGTCSVAGTGGWQTWITNSCNVSSASGTHNLYLKFTGGSGYLFNMNWFKFVAGSNPTPTPAVTPTPTTTRTPTRTPSSGAPTPTATGAVLFTTGLESGNTQPTWADTTEVITNVTGYLSGINPECGVRTGETCHAGTASLLFSGTDNNATTSFCYFKVFDVNIPITATTKLSYWFYPQMALAQGVAVDFVCTDGTTLRDSGAKDQNNISMHPGNSRGTVNTWNQVQCNVGQWLNGKTIDRILVGYDLGPSTGQFRGYIDDILISN